MSGLCLQLVRLLSKIKRWFHQTGTTTNSLLDIAQKLTKGRLMSAFNEHILMYIIFILYIFDSTDNGMMATYFKSNSFPFNYKCITELSHRCNRVKRITVKPVIKACQILTHSAFILILSKYLNYSVCFMVLLRFGGSDVYSNVTLWLCFAFISLGNIDISGLMDAFPAQHTSYQRRVNRGGHELIRGEGLPQCLYFLFSLTLSRI